jgi:lysophospholipase L1-like esterase
MTVETTCPDVAHAVERFWAAFARLLPVAVCAAVLLLDSSLSWPSETTHLQGIEAKANQDGELVMIRGAAVLHSGESLVLSPARGLDGTPMLRPRLVAVRFVADGKTSLTIEPGARLIADGEPGTPIVFASDPVDPDTKPAVTVRSGAHTAWTHVSFINVALRVEGAGHALSDVSVQFAGDQPAFTFAGAQGTFDHLLAHHSTWGFSFEPLQGRRCRLTIRDSVIRSCARSTGRKESEPSTYVVGGSIRSIPPPGSKHEVRFDRVDWDPLWDDTQGLQLRASGQRPRIVAIGDSIAQGCCRYVNFWNYLDGNDDIEHSWPYQLQLRVPQYFVINKGEGGYLTTQMMARLPSIIEKIRPEYCYIGGGTNDIFRTNFTPEQTDDNYRTMWRQLRAAGIVPIQLAITPETVHPELQSRIARTNALLKEAARQDAVRFEDVYSLLVSPSSANLDPAYDPGDGLHPNKLGYQKMAQSLYVPGADPGSSMSARGKLER